MKKLPIILNVVLLVAVVVLYVLHFSGNSNATSKTSDSEAVSSPAPTGNIVYINIDSVVANYKMQEDLVAELQDKLSTSEAKLQTQQRAFEKKVKDFQYKAERQLETRAKLAEMQQNLAAEEQQLLALQNQLQYQLAEEEQVARMKVLNAIMEYLKKVEAEDSYQFVLGNSFGGNILYANDNLNISKEVIEGLNAEYQNSKEDE